MNVHYHTCKGNIVADALSRKSIGSTTHIEDEKKELAKDIHRQARLGVRLVHYTSEGVSVHPSSISFLVVEVKKGHQLDPFLIEMNESVLVKMNESFSLRGDGILRYQDRLCVQDVNDL